MESFPGGSGTIRLIDRGKTNKGNIYRVTRIVCILFESIHLNGKGFRCLHIRGSRSDQLNQ